MFKDNLISMRKIHGYSQDELADKIGVSRQTLSKYETGESLLILRDAGCWRMFLGLPWMTW